MTTKRAPVVLREPRNGIYYYADISNKFITHADHKYQLLFWRETEASAKQLADAHKTLHVKKQSAPDAIVRKVVFKKGGLYESVPVEKTITCYGVYGRIK